MGARRNTVYQICHEIDNTVTKLTSETKGVHLQGDFFLIHDDDTHTLSDELP